MPNTTGTAHQEASVRIGQRSVLAAGLDPRPGLPVLHGGGGRVASPEEEQLLGVDEHHHPRPDAILPHRNQCSYDRHPVQQQQRVAVLENEHLRAEVLLDLGGRLWTLFDKDAEREVLHQPEALQQANLALCNAWFAGGVEWNLGVTGHWALTSSPVAAAVVEHEGQQVLRMWAWERMLELVWQVDMWLPAGARSLAVHVRLHNPHATDRPAYWWSNTAVPQVEGGRVLVEAEHAYMFGYHDRLTRVEMPMVDGVDVTFPTDARSAADYFFETDDPHPWIAAIGPDGYGLGHSSTARLRSRKLFVWGVSPGGNRWQRWLGEDRSYIEIQAGLARTQLEHLRLPAGQTWEWTELYGPVQLDASTLTDELHSAARAARPLVVDEAEVDAAHAFLSGAALAPVVGDWDQMRGASDNQGWGALAVALGDVPADPAVPFDEACLSDEQQAWFVLGREGTVDEVLAGSVMCGEHWQDRLERAEAGPVRDLQLGYARHAAGRTQEARELWRSSAETRPGFAALHALAVTSQDAHEKARLLRQALQVGDVPAGPMADELLAEALAAMVAAGEHSEVLALVEQLDPERQGLPRVELARAQALIGVGRVDEAARIVDRPLVVPDLREGDRCLDQLWGDYQKARGTQEPLPAHYDFRMFSEAPTEVEPSGN